MSSSLDEVINVLRSEGWQKALRILEELKVDVELFLVYYDLVRRGKKVRVGLRERTLIYEDGSGRIYEVLVLREGERISVQQLIVWGRRASADSHEPLIAVIDENGGVTYYETHVLRSFS